MTVGPSAFVSPTVPFIARRRPRRALTSYPIRAVQDVPRVNDDFILPNSDHHQPSTPSPAQSAIDIRLQNKRRELAQRKVEEDEEELRRMQLANEELGESDLADIIGAAHLSADAAFQDGIVFQGMDVSQEVTNSSASNRKFTPLDENVPPKPTAATSPIPLKDENNSATPENWKELESETAPTQAIRKGQLVMQARHGVGRFRGIERTIAEASIGNNSGRAVQEYAVLEYRDGDVYIPVSQFDTIRGLNKEELQSAKLDSIAGDMLYPGRGNGAKKRRSRYLARTKTRQKIRKQLVNLQALYTSRTTLRREPFPVDHEAEQRFSDKCEFDLTKDQKTATAQIFHDITESHRPMDRLICGDVGFGKTEVALRAAFRVLRAGKQVAILAPTTILACQHYETLCKRFGDEYPEYKAACFTRFVKRKDVLKSKEMVANGEIQIAVGTHILLGDKFLFHSLGLLIVDEEHRLGVNQKEKLRARYNGVDTLFLSATPIPRTLHLALSGLRDASILQTPPVGRKPVITRVCPSGSGAIRQAIGKEVKRGGQVFFVVPRIEGIEATANWIRDLFPKLRVVVAHGSVSGLEDRVWSFAKGEHDVLVCTTIIENGIDMPNVNTVIIQDAGRFGLAQLHQLRGRVGRSDVQAYAWMLFNAENVAASQTAYDRLKTLEKNSDLGSGFAIAQRDMEMRGVGEVIGVEQHGNTSIGAEEYAVMLAEELEHARTGKPIPATLPNVAPATEIFLPLAALLPSEYIPDFDAKMNTYSALSKAKSRKELKAIVNSLQRRYGELPVQAKRHVCVLELKIFAKPLGISRIFTERQHVVLDWPIEEMAFKTLVAFLPDEQTRNRCELRVSDERVFLRGLGICSGDVQLAKLRSYLRIFIKAAEGMRKERERINSGSLAKSLSITENENIW